MEYDETIKDKEFGTILLRYSYRATRYSLKVMNGQIIGTIPLDGSENGIKKVINLHREWLRKALSNSPSKPFWDERTNLQTATLRIRIVKRECTKFQIVSGGEKEVHIVCPLDTDLHTDMMQEFFRTIIEGILRNEADRYLPSRVKSLAGQFGFEVNAVKVNGSRSHWGSCTAKKNINLSYHLMLLPWHLIDYVLLHELCHTREMNHGEGFWRLMNLVTNNKALALREELKSHHML